MTLTLTGRTKRSVAVQFTLGTVNIHHLERLPSTVPIGSQIPRQRRRTDTRQATDLLMRQTSTFQPQHFHPALHSGVWMVIAFIIQRLGFGIAQFESDHRRSPDRGLFALVYPDSRCLKITTGYVVQYTQWAFKLLLAHRLRNGAGSPRACIKPRRL